MNLAIAAFFFITGFALGALGATVSHLADQLDDADRDGHRR